MIKLEEQKCYFTDVKYLRGCSFKVEDEITMRPICSYAVDGMIMLLCSKIDEDIVEFEDYDTGYRIYGCNSLVKKEVKIPNITTDNYEQVINTIANQNHLWISLENIEEVTPELKVKFANERTKELDAEREIVDAIIRLDKISITNINKTIKEVEIKYMDSQFNQAYAENAEYDLKNRNKQLGQKRIETK